MARGPAGGQARELFERLALQRRVHFRMANLQRHALAQIGERRSGQRMDGALQPEEKLRQALGRGGATGDEIEERRPVDALEDDSAPSSGLYNSFGARRGDAELMRGARLQQLGLDRRGGVAGPKELHHAAGIERVELRVAARLGVRLTLFGKQLQRKDYRGAVSGSIFDGLSMQRSGGGAFDVAIPHALVDARRAGDLASRMGLAFHEDTREGALKEARGRPRAWRIEGASFEALKRFFAALHGQPGPYPKTLPRAGAEPLASCVIVVNENWRFVEEQLVPSLAANTQASPIELILVFNGSAGPREGVLEDSPQAVTEGSECPIHLRSTWGAVAAAYNAGARKASGRYVAFFHDDCIIDDPQWLEKCISAIESGAGAVAGEFRRLERLAGQALAPLPVAKCVPLVLRRADFEALGGFDEFHYVGYEDLDFTLALRERGLEPVQADIRLRHYGGMSSTLKYCPAPGLAELHALCALPPAAIVRRFREFVERGVRVGEVDLMRLGLDVQLLYVLKKHRAQLARLDPRYPEATRALERSLTGACPFDATLILPRFREMDRILKEGG